MTSENSFRHAMLVNARNFRIPLTSSILSRLKDPSTAGDWISWDLCHLQPEEISISLSASTISRNGQSHELSQPPTTQWLPPLCSRKALGARRASNQIKVRSSKIDGFPTSLNVSVSTTTFQLSTTLSPMDL